MRILYWLYTDRDSHIMSFFYGISIMPHYCNTGSRLCWDLFLGYASHMDHINQICWCSKPELDAVQSAPAYHSRANRQAGSPPLHAAFWYLLLLLWFLWDYKGLIPSHAVRLGVWMALLWCSFNSKVAALYRVWEVYYIKHLTPAHIHTTQLLLSLLYFPLYL